MKYYQVKNQCTTHILYCGIQCTKPRFYCYRATGFGKCNRGLLIELPSALISVSEMGSQKLNDCTNISP